MKPLFFIVLLLCGTYCFAQNEHPLDNIYQYGYVNGQRLDSIEAKYGQADITLGMRIAAGNTIRRFTFEYGQKWKNENEIRITNKEGKVFTFINTAEALNFFDYNGWELVILNINPYQILLKNKKYK